LNHYEEKTQVSNRDLGHPLSGGCSLSFDEATGRTHEETLAVGSAA